MLTAIYIINRLPTLILHHKTPYEILLGTKPDYTHLKVFGCLAFANNPIRTSDKFQPRGVSCVFLEYPQNQKGYRLLNMLIKQVFTSRDVQFYEHIFPFHKSSLSQYLQPIPVPILGTTHWPNEYLGENSKFNLCFSSFFLQPPAILSSWRPPHTTNFIQIPLQFFKNLL